MPPVDLRVVMPLDVYHLQTFYGSPLGELSCRLVGRVIRARWQDAAGLTVAALGFGPPYLDLFKRTADRCIALMPAQQGVLIWPEERRCSCALVEAPMLPLPDASVDRLLLAHALEAAERPEALLEELWRITAPEGRVIVVVPSRRGVWARVDGTPYGHGLPYSRAQLRELLHRALFSPVFWGEALYAPPISRQLAIRAAPTIERLGASLGLPFAGVHIVEATKQVYRPLGARVVTRTLVVPLNPALAPTANRQVDAGRLSVNFFGLAPRRTRVLQALTILRNR